MLRVWRSKLITTALTMRYTEALSIRIFNIK